MRHRHSRETRALKRQISHYRTGVRCLGNYYDFRAGRGARRIPAFAVSIVGPPLTPQDQLALKFDLDCCVYFDGPAVERRGLVAPLADGVYCGFGKNWVAINYCDFADAAVHSENYVK
jgi:hypothetical protein